MGGRPLGVVLHCTAGPGRTETQYAATVGWFGQARSRVSAHYLVDIEERVCQFLEEDQVAWHAAAPGFNQRWIGIELAMSGPEMWIRQYSDFQYEAAGWLVAEASRRWGFPLERGRVVAHSEIQGDRSDPGPMWDWGRFLAVAEGYRRGR